MRDETFIIFIRIKDIDMYVRVRLKPSQCKGMYRMEVTMSIVFLLFLGCFCFEFIRVLIKMKQPMLFPETKEEMVAIRKQPQKAVNLPTALHQKTGILLNAVTLLFVSSLVVFNLFSSNVHWTAYIIFIPALLTLGQAWNMFAIVKDGVLSGGRFVPWKHIRSYKFEPIDTNHRFYGYAPEVNSGYELKIETNRRSMSCLVTSETVKEKLVEVLNAHLR